MRPETERELAAGEARLRVSPDNGGRWSSLRVGGLELLGRGVDALVGWGCYPMAPYAGRIRRGRLDWAGRRHQLPIDMPPHAIHGVTLDRLWTVVEHESARAVLRCDFDTRWPWRGHVVQTLDLAAGGLAARLEVHADNEPMPAWTGFHPWFARHLGRGAPARIEIAAAGILPRDTDGMPRPEPVPVPSPPWDDVFVDVAWPAAVLWDGAVRLEISADTPFAVVFDERPGAVCVEPQTAPPNAAELGLANVVEPGDPLVLNTVLRWELGGA